MRSYKCRVCGQQHEGLPLHYGAAAPALYFMIPESERGQRCELTSDVCMIDEQHWFIVGNLEIPILGAEDRFSWDVWVPLSEQDGKPVGVCFRSLAKLALTEEEIKSIRVPVLILFGDRDFLKKGYVEPLERVRKDWQVIDVKDADHVSCILRPQFKEEIQKWLAKQAQR
jgi:hypothetical protein